MSAGDQIEIHEDGTRHLIPGPSPIKQKILASHGHWRRKQASCEEVKIRRIAWKKSEQAKRGWPSDKSPI